MGLKSATARREKEEKSTIDELEKELGTLTADKIYGYFVDKDYPDHEIEKLSEIFRGDDHAIWYISFVQTKAHFPNSSDDEIMEALDSLSDKGVIYGGANIVGNMYGLA